MTTSKKVMEITRFSKSIFYRVACDCMSNKCDLTVELEKDDQTIWLNMYKHFSPSAYYGRDWDHFDFIRVFWNKIKMCFKILFLGYIEIEETTVFQDEEHIQAFIQALEEGREYLKKENADTKDN